MLASSSRHLGGRWGGGRWGGGRWGGGEVGDGGRWGEVRGWEGMRERESKEGAG